MGRTPEIKICGITRSEEAAALNEIKAAYAGFVCGKRSRRKVSFCQAEEIRKHLDEGVKRVAVTVSPELELLRNIEQAEFDIIQIHGSLREEVLNKSRIPVWQACNIEKPEDLKSLRRHEKITGYVLDAGTAGGGRPFDWTDSKAAVDQARAMWFEGKIFVLAGGLNPGNVREAVGLFSPDVVDVSSGVEGKKGKERGMILEFAEKVRRCEKTCESIYEIDG